MRKHLNNDNSTAKIRWQSFNLLVVILIIGALLAWWTASRTDNELRANLLTQAHIAAMAVDVEHVEELTGTEADQNAPYYLFLKKNFANIISVNSRYRFIYLLGLRPDGEVYFIVDNESPDSKDYSPPGQVYEEADPELLSVFETKKMAVLGPTPDHWGVWVSALVPLTEPQNDRLVAVLGIDVDARTWRWMQIRAALLPIILTFVLAAVMYTGLMLFARRKLAEDTIAYQKDRFGYILDSANVGTWEWNVQTGETIFNERWANIIGYTLEEISPVSVKTWEKYVHPDDLAASYELLDMYFKGEKESYEIECRTKHKDGRWIWIIDKGKVISWTDDGKPLWMYGTHQDISKRKQAEIALRENEAVLQSILDATLAGVALLEDRRFVKVNNSMCKMTGFSEEEMLGQFSQILYSSEEEYLRIGKELYENMERTGLGMKEAILRHKQGAPIDVILCLTPYDPADPTGKVCATVLDITELKQAEEKLREKTEELDRYFTSSLDLLCIADTGGHFIRLNPEWENVLGYSINELEGSLFFDFIHPDDLESTYAAISRLDAQEQVLSFENRYRCKDGSYRWIEWRSHPQGNIIYAAARDVTQRKLAEEAIRESEQYLRSIFRTTPTGIGVVNNRIFIQVNDQLCTITGFSRDELIGQSARIIYPSDEEYEFVGREKYRQIAETGSGTVETQWQRKDGRIIDVLLSSTPIDYHDQSKGVTFTALDITARKQAENELRLNESRLDTLVELGQMTTASLTELTDFTLEKAIELTVSKIGYLAFMNEDESVLTMYSWSKTAMKQCKIIDKPIIYPIETTGLWGECVRQRKPVITNDYPAPNPLKKGLPEGHVELSRHMNIPVFDGDRIVAVAGVGNKESDYDEGDIRQLTLIMEGMWRIIERERVQSALRSERDLFSAGPVFTIVWEPAEGWPVKQVSANVVSILGYTQQEMLADGLNPKNWTGLEQKTYSSQIGL